MSSIKIFSGVRCLNVKARSGCRFLTQTATSRDAIRLELMFLSTPSERKRVKSDGRMSVMARWHDQQQEGVVEGFTWIKAIFVSAVN